MSSYRPTEEPIVPIRIQNDSIAFNPKVYSRIILNAKGQMYGKVRLVHDDSKSDGLISTRMWVSSKGDIGHVAIKPSFAGETHTFSLELCNKGANIICHEIIIQFPHMVGEVDVLTINAPNTSLEGDSLEGLIFGNIQTCLSNGSIDLDTVRADTISLRTSNASITGVYEAGHIDLDTSNGNIDAKLDIFDARNGRQAMVSTKTLNASVDVYVTATETTRGLWMKNSSRNGDVKVDVLLGKADRGSWIMTETEDARVDFNVDASQLGHPLDIMIATSNGAIESTVIVPSKQLFTGMVESSNAPVKVELKGEFEGRFDVRTSHHTALVMGPGIEFELDDMAFKRGYRIRDEPSNFKIHCANGPTALRFSPFPPSVSGTSCKNN
ncbi:hypothetical protein EDD21DRAFT_435108 [Dissophora ornata]|nr:hypothetical protein EDD21DRAFT_435108 [Dissophora ornata]